MAPTAHAASPPPTNVSNSAEFARANECLSTRWDIRPSLPSRTAPGRDKRRLGAFANPSVTRQGCASCGSRASGYATVMPVLSIAGIGGGGGYKDRSTSIASPTSARKPRKNSANRMSEMRLAIRDTLVMPSAPAISEITRKTMAYFSKQKFPDVALRINGRAGRPFPARRCAGRRSLVRAHFASRDRMGTG
jgi:hypothetical protein